MASVVSRGQTLPSPAPAPHRWARIPRAHPAPAAAPAPKEGVEHLPKRSLPDLLEGEGKGNETDDPGKKRRAVGPRRWRRILRAHPEPAPASKFKPLAKASLQDLIDENLDTSDEIHCDTEEDKVAFRAFKAENVRIYQEMLDREKLGQKLVFVPLEPTDTPYDSSQTC